MKVLPIVAAATLTILLIWVATAHASLTTAQAQTEFNKAVKEDAAEGFWWKDGGSLHPLITTARAGGWVAEGDYVIRCRATCSISSQRCYWKGWLSPSGYWIERRKSNCR